MSEKGPQPQFLKSEILEAEKENTEEEKNIISLFKKKEFSNRLNESAKIVDNMGYESGFNWVLRKDGKLEVSEVFQGTTAEVFLEKKSEIKEKEKFLIYGDMHFHTIPKKESIFPSESDLAIFTIIPEEISKKHFSYLENFWQGIGIVKEDNFINLLFLNGKIGPTDCQFLCEELKEVKEFDKRLKLFKNYGFNVHFFENVDKLKIQEK